jgi:hypothetical protein
MVTILTRVVFCALLLSATLGLNAHGAAKKAPPPTRGKIISVDAKSNTIVIEAAPGAPQQTCVLNDQSTVEVNNKSVTPKQLKAGLYIRSVRLDSSTPPVVEDLDLTTTGD